MVQYYCKHCEKNVSSSECPFCGERAEFKSSTIYWCDDCNIPIYEEVCPICGASGKRIGSDLRPVFPEERLLLEIILGCPMRYRNSSVWNASGNHYFVDGKKIQFTVSQTKSLDAELIRNELEKYKEQNTQTAFDAIIEKFLAANRGRYDYLYSEASDFIRKVSSSYESTERYVSFSGGKDSTVVSNLVMRALCSEDIPHIFGDTTLEFPETIDYVKRFHEKHPGTLILTAKNKDKNFEEMWKWTGPPSRVNRWCCTIFKTGAIQRKLAPKIKTCKRILTFYGIRRSESTSRSKYERESDSPKIAIQKTVSPIIDWLDFDIWLYLLMTKIDFNKAYRYGYTRVGCWCCPNNSSWSEFMSRVYMPKQYAHMRQLLIDFAKKIGKPDPETYVDDGKWKARQGGNGLEYAQSSVVTFEPCALQENTLNFDLQRPITEELYELFKPFGFINREMGNSRLGEVFVTNAAGELLIKLQGRIGTKALKVSILSKKIAHCKSVKAIEDKIKCQITKYQMCMGCLACESICMHGAISINANQGGLVSYSISDKKCIRCGECINHYDGGCYMRKVMCIKRP